MPDEIDDEAVTYLQSYDWPGNVRELQNVLERAAIVVRGRQIALADLPELGSAGGAPTDGAKGVPLKERVNAFERGLIVDALRQANGNQSEAARLLGTTRTALQYKIRIFGVT
jgi:Nif-specific regulatory protein